MDFGTEQGCPTCNHLLAVTLFPTVNEVLERDDIPSHDRTLAEISQAKNDDFERRSLKSPEQLPALCPPPEVLLWDEAGEGFWKEIVVRHGELELWREPSYYEHMDRFREVAAILKTRYPSLRRIDYTDAAWMNLMGDKHNEGHVEALNKRLSEGV